MPMPGNSCELWDLATELNVITLIAIVSDNKWNKPV